MQAALEQIELNDQESFSVRIFQDNMEESSWHYHNNYEISFIIEGSGKRIVADSIEEFNAGDLVFLGLRLPHVWIADKNKFGMEGSRSLESVYLQFDKRVISHEILQVPELKNVRRALKLSERGVRITGETLNKVSSLMLELPYLKGFRRISFFYEILDIIGKSTTHKLLASEEYIRNKFNSSNDRINKIHEYLMNHYNESINLGAIADLVHMAPASVCRFFRSQVGITIFDYLIKIKIDVACSLLLNNDINIAAVCYDCGFNNLSHFNKQFKKVTNQTPSKYRRKFRDLASN